MLRQRESSHIYTLANKLSFTRFISPISTTMMHQEISPEETARIMSKLATEWIERFDKDYFFSKDRKEVTEAVEYLFKILYHVLQKMECCSPADILVPMLMYADKYVSKF